MGTCQGCHSSYSESQTGTVESKMKSLNEMSKSTKFSSLKLSLTYTPANISKILSEDQAATDFDENKDTFRIHKSVRRRRKLYDFSAVGGIQVEPAEFTIVQLGSKSQSAGKSSRSRRLRNSADDRSFIEYNQERGEQKLAQFMDITEYIQLLNNPADSDNKSYKSILKQKSLRSSNSSCDGKKVKFARGTKFSPVVTVSRSQRFSRRRSEH